MTDTAPTSTAEQIDETLIPLLQQRSATYGLLARLYREEIDQQLLDRLHETLFPVATGDEDVDRGYLPIATYLSNLWSESVHELTVDFSRCFFGNGIDAYSAAYPCESVYTSPKRLMMQDARDEVLAIYRSEGLDKNSSWTNDEDHIAVELEFVQTLCDRTVEALERGDTAEARRLVAAQHNFLDDHLCAWVPMMTADLKRFAKTDLYQGLAYLTDGFLRTDLAFLDDLTGTSRSTQGASGASDAEGPDAQDAEGSETQDSETADDEPAADAGREAE
jgi:TorA maturation chaperone TorD